MDLPQITSTPIRGLLVIRLDVRGDQRGWFKENWQRDKMVALGLPDFSPVQNNVSFNAAPGTTRGLHAEPWDKLVSVARGRIFGAWVDLRDGPGYGQVFTTELDENVAVYVPRGVANGFQTLEADTAYSYLVNDHWSPQARYAMVNLADRAVAIPWPIPLDRAVVSDKDRGHPMLAEADPYPLSRTVILGAGQLGSALRLRMPDADVVTRRRLDLADPDAIRDFDWSGVDTVINAAAWTDVDGAETEVGRRGSWAVNATAVAALAQAARRHRFRLAHVSTDYVFDGTAEVHTVDEPVAPLNAYGQSKAAGEFAAQTVPQHYVVRTSWVVGDGKNFVATMRELARRGVSPRVVNDQFGRLTHANNLAAGLVHLLDTEAAAGVYHLSDDGPVRSWADIARDVFAREGRDPADVTGVSTADYFADTPHAPRPPHSTLDLSTIRQAGYDPPESAIE